MPERRRVVLTLEEMPDARPFEIRLRRLLKIAKRWCRLKGLRIEWPEANDRGADQADPGLPEKDPAEVDKSGPSG